MKRGLNTLQRVIIFVWVVAVVVLAMFPPWTVHETDEWLYPDGISRNIGDYTSNQFRWFFATPKWYVRQQSELNSPLEGYDGARRYDLLALQIFCVSALAVGLLLVASRRLPTTKGGEQ